MKNFFQNTNADSILYQITNFALALALLQPWSYIFCPFPNFRVGREIPTLREGSILYTRYLKNPTLTKTSDQ